MGLRKPIALKSQKCDKIVSKSDLTLFEDNQVPDKDIDLALTYRDLFVLNPEIYTYGEPEEEPND
jgi:hypothetical protein